MFWRVKIWFDCKWWEKFGFRFWNWNFEEIVFDLELKVYLKFSLWLIFVILLVDKLNEIIYIVFGLFKCVFEGINVCLLMKIIVFVLEIKFVL